jgi:hypothetical protein
VGNDGRAADRGNDVRSPSAATFAILKNVGADHSTHPEQLVPAEQAMRGIIAEAAAAMLPRPRPG